MADAKARFRIEGEDATAAAFRSAAGNAKGAATEIKNAFTKAFAAITASAVVKGAIDAAVGFERINTTLKVATGSARGAGEAFAYVKGLSSQLGLDLSTTAEAFAKFSAAAKGTNLEGAKSRDIFESVSLAARALSLSSEDTSGVLLALSQMISKGKVQAEELRGQLGERLPGAFQLAAKAMGVTTAQLDEMLKKGEVTADELLPKLARELRATFGKDALEATDSLGASINRLSTAWDTFKATVADVLPINTAVRALTEVLDKLNVALGKDEAAKLKQQIDYWKAHPEGGIAIGMGETGTQVMMPWEVDREVAKLEAKLLQVQRRGAKSLAETRGQPMNPAADPTPKTKEQLAAEAKAFKDAVRNRGNLREFQDELDRKTAESVKEVAKDYGDAWQAESDRVHELFLQNAQYAREAGDKMSVYWDEAARNMQDAFAQFLFDPFRDGLKGMLRGFVDVVRRMVAEAAAAKLFDAFKSSGTAAGLIGGVKKFLGFANGGSFTVGGAGGTDSQLVAFRATPGERVDVRTPGQQRGGGVVIAPVYNIDARGATQDLVQQLPRILEQNNRQIYANLARALPGMRF